MDPWFNYLATTIICGKDLGKEVSDDAYLLVASIWTTSTSEVRSGSHRAFWGEEWQIGKDNMIWDKPFMFSAGGIRVMETFSEWKATRLHP
jgi:hypothetical protein